MKLADKISFDLHRWARGTGREVLIPNYYYGFYEADLFRLMPSGIVIEYEIKISRADWKNDFKKGDQYENSHIVKRDGEPSNKHQRILKGLGPNKFYFVVPEGLISVEECPSYAGLIYAYEDNGRMYFTFMKSAPMLRKKKAWDVRPDIYKDIAESLSFREMHMREKLRDLKLQLKLLKENGKQ